MRSVLAIAAVVAAVATIADAKAQGGYPAKPIRMLTPFSAGGGSDILARLIGPQITEAWGQQVIVENRPGAAGNLGAGLVVNAPPDGYTLIIVSGTYGASGALYKLPYDTVTAISPIILIGTTPLVLSVHPSLPVKDLKAFIALARSKPDALSYGTAGLGDLAHLAGEMFKQHTKIRMTQVPYKGSAPLMIGIVSGEVPVSISSLVPTVPHVKAARLRHIAVTTPKRSRAFPEVPTFGETVPGFDVTHWYGMWGPRGLPADVVARWNREVARIIRSEAIQKFFSTDGLDAAGGPPEEFRDRIRSALEKWRKVVKEANIVIGS